VIRLQPLHNGCKQVGFLFPNESIVRMQMRHNDNDIAHISGKDAPLEMSRIFTSLTTKSADGGARQQRHIVSARRMQASSKRETGGLSPVSKTIRVGHGEPPTISRFLIVPWEPIVPWRLLCPSFPPYSLHNRHNIRLPAPDESEHSTHGTREFRPGIFGSSRHVSWRLGLT